jgi:hypothetical protein
VNILDLLDAESFNGNSRLPFYFIKDNIVIANGKCGSKTLQTVSDRSWHSSIITSKEFLSKIDQGYKLHFVIRDPVSRFRSGILEDWCVNMHYYNRNYDADRIDVNSFVLYRLSVINAALVYSQEYHISNWLSRITDTVYAIPKNKTYRIWKLEELPTLLLSLGFSSTTRIPDTKDKSCVKFLEKYDNLPKITVDMIQEYLKSEIQIYNRLIELREQI